MLDTTLPLHAQSSTQANAPVDRAFYFLDDPMALSAHIGMSSLMMMGSRMAVKVDAGGGHVINSKISMQANKMRIPLSLQQVINDTLAKADVAMGTATDVAMNSAQVTLVKGDLRGIAIARQLSEATVRNIKQILLFAFLYNALGIPIAALEAHASALISTALDSYRDMRDAASELFFSTQYGTDYSDFSS